MKHHENVVLYLGYTEDEKSWTVRPSHALHELGRLSNGRYGDLYREAVQGRWSCENDAFWSMKVNMVSLQIPGKIMRPNKPAYWYPKEACSILGKRGGMNIMGPG